MVRLDRTLFKVLGEVWGKPATLKISPTVLSSAEAMGLYLTDGAAPAKPSSDTPRAGVDLAPARLIPCKLLPRSGSGFSECCWDEDWL